MKKSKEIKLEVLEAIRRAINDEREEEGKSLIDADNIRKALKRALSTKETSQTIAYHDQTVNGFIADNFTKKEMFDAVSRALKAAYENDGENMYSEIKLREATIFDGKLILLRKEVALVPEHLIEVIPPQSDDE